MRVGGGDPGANGAVALVTGVGAMAAKVFPLAKLDRFDYIELIDSLCLDVLFIEKVSPMPARGKDGKPRRVGTKSMFTFGMNVERLYMAAAANGIPVREVTPAKWQKGVGLYFPKGSTHADHKRQARDLAQQMFARKVSLAVADALLIAEYGRMQMGPGQ